MKAIYATLILTMTIQPLTAQKTIALHEYPDMLYVSPDNIAVDSTQRLNLVVPENAESVPLLIWIGGGAWSYVDRSVEMNLARTFAQEGMAVASIGHRLSPATWKDPSLKYGVQHPNHIEDIASAFHWLYTHADKYGFDIHRIFIGGFSSGAHLATLLCADPTYLAKYNLKPSIIKGVIPIGGAYDILHYHQTFANGERSHLAELHVEAVFGSTEAQMKNASPSSFLSTFKTPMLLISDTGTFPYSDLFEQQLRETDYRDFQSLFVHNLSHGALWKDIGESEHSIYRAMIIQFILS